MRPTVKRPLFPAFAVWGACSRCGTRFAYESLRREKLTGLLLCTDASWPSPRARGCWDPWHPSLSFQTRADRSIEPPREPLPMRTGLDDIFSAAFGPTIAAPDGNRWNYLVRSNFQTIATPAPVYINAFSTASKDGPRFMASPQAVDRSALDPTAFDQFNVVGAPDGSASYDGVFVPSQSTRKNVPPSPPTGAQELTEDFPPLNLPLILIDKKV